MNLKKYVRAAVPVSTAPTAPVALAAQNATGLGDSSIPAAPLANVLQNASQAGGAAQAKAGASSDILSGVHQTLSAWSQYFEALAVICFILALLWMLVWLLRKRNTVVSGKAVGLRVESRLGIGPKQWLVVARFMDKRVLIGVTDHQMTLLSEQSMPETAAKSAPSFALELNDAKNAQRPS